MPFTAHRPQEGTPAARRRQGHALLHRRRPQDHRRRRRHVVLHAGHGRSQIAEAIASRPPRWITRRRSSSAFRRPSNSPAASPIWAGRPRPRVLLQFRLRRPAEHRAEDRAGLSPDPRQGTRTRLIGRERVIMASASAVPRWAASSITARCSARCCRRRSSSPHLRPRQAGLHQGRAGIWRAFRRRAGAAGQSARRLHHRRRHRRADGRIDRRAAGAEGLSQAAARDHPEARHPPDLRRGHHRLWPARLRLRAERYGVLPDMLTFAKASPMAQPDGRRAGARHHPRRLHERPGAHGGLTHGYPIRRIRSPAPRRWRRSTSTATKSCSSAPGCSSRNSPTP